MRYRGAVLTKQDLEAIRAIVREEIERAMRRRERGERGASHEHDDHADGEDRLSDYVDATLSWMRSEPGADKRMHAVELAKIQREIDHAPDPKARRRAEMRLARLERQGPRKFAQRRITKRDE
jgi:hypothetical protein